MHRGILKIALKSIKYHRKQVIYQFLIVLLLCAVITGSLMTGRSVKTSLKRTALEKTGNTGVFISSGFRYFDKQLTAKFGSETGLTCTGLLELRGSSQGLISQRSTNNISIYAVEDDFFGFHNIHDTRINPGEVIVNTKLASALQVKEGDDIIITFSNISDIPADAPFAPDKEAKTSVALKVGKIAGAEEIGNFSMSISQIPSYNVFMNLSDLENFHGKEYKINRLLIERNESSTRDITPSLRKAIEPADIGLHIRETRTPGEYEIISDRIFIDEVLIKSISERIPRASPVITYLANRIENGSLINPYSFVSALPSDIYIHAPSGNGMIINKWLSEDINAAEGDSVRMTWYAPDSLNHLIETSRIFRIEKVTEMEGIWADSTLMPEFPGISGSESCSQWDAGIPIMTNLIRGKDEDYWNMYKGTPKAFINYETGKEIWGNNYGPATAIRFPAGISPQVINESLKGLLEPSIIGFTVSNIYEESIRAADESVDFGSLFLALGFFLIVASFVLLSFAVSWYFDLKKDEVRVLYSLGFKNRIIGGMLLIETSLSALAGCVAGSIAGFFVNIVLVAALNSVWTGAVQTNTLVSVFDTGAIVTGFFITFMMTVIFMVVKSRNYLKQLNTRGTKHYTVPSAIKNMRILMAAGAITVIMFVVSLISGDRITFSFIAGSALLLTLVLFWRQYYLAGIKGRSNLSGLYYLYYPSHAITPVLFIAAGIFAVFITTVNRKDFDAAIADSSSGTGGYLLWMETSLPLTDDLSTERGRLNLGLDEEPLSGLKFVQMKRSAGNDASCLNLNHITAPPLLGADPEIFVSEEAFSFSKAITRNRAENPWTLLNRDVGRGAVYGIADQTVLDWGLKTGVGDTIILRAENGQPLKIIIAAGLQSSVFQGYVIISKQNFAKYYPSVPGNSVFLIDGESNSPDLYKTLLSERLTGFGANIESTADRLASFYEITNTYLAVFGVFGGLGMIIGIAGLGFVLMRNYNRRKREFALMLATGFTPRKIRNIIFPEQVMILFAGIISGVIPAIVATLPSLQSNHEIPWVYLTIIILAILFTGLLAVVASTGQVKKESLITALRKD